VKGSQDLYDSSPKSSRQAAKCAKAVWRYFFAILANPPFKGSIDKSDINERFTLKTTKTELLFVELMYDLLVTGGRCGVIVPDGVLFGTSNAHTNARKILVDKCKLEGVISMLSGVFKPYAVLEHSSTPSRQKDVGTPLSVNRPFYWGAGRRMLLARISTQVLPEPGCQGIDT